MTGTNVLTPAQMTPATKVRMRLPRCRSTNGSIRRIHPFSDAAAARSVIGEPFHQLRGQTEQLTLGRCEPFGHGLGQPRPTPERVLVEHGPPLACDVDAHLPAIRVVRAADDQAVGLEP